MRIIKYKAELNEDKNPILVKEAANNYPEIPSEKLNTPGKIVDMINTVFSIGRLAEEYVWMVAVDGANHFIGLFEISHGTVNMSVINRREVFIRLLLSGAVSFFLIHNHPSGDLTPSSQDIESTKIMITAGKLMGIPLMDHIIIGKTSYGVHYYSFAEHSDIEF